MQGLVLLIKTPGLSWQLLDRSCTSVHRAEKEMDRGKETAGCASFLVTETVGHFGYVSHEAWLFDGIVMIQH